MSSNVADLETRLDGASQGYSSRSAVRGRVAGLIVHRLSKETPSARALRAQLRGALGKEVGSIPAIWDLTLDDRSEHMGDAPTRGEKAITGRLPSGHCIRGRTRGRCTIARSTLGASRPLSAWSRRGKDRKSVV